MVRVAAGHMVVPAVEMPLEPHQRVLAGEGARQPHRHQRRLGAGGGEAHPLDRRHKALDRLRPAHLARVVGAEMRALRQRLGHRRRHRRMPVAEQQRAMAAVEVDIAVAVHVPFVRPLGAGDVDAVGIEVARIMRDAAGKQRGGLRGQLGRSLGAAGVGGDNAGVAERVARGAGHGASRGGGRAEAAFCAGAARLGSVAGRKGGTVLTAGPRRHVARIGLVAA